MIIEPLRDPDERIGQHNSSSERARRTGITKAGPTRLRWALVQAAWNFRRTRQDDPAVLWSRGIEQKRGRRIAIVALARKLAGILYALWRDGTTYDRLRGAAPAASGED
jgi:transposase